MNQKKGQVAKPSAQMYSTCNTHLFALQINAKKPKNLKMW